MHGHWTSCATTAVEADSTGLCQARKGRNVGESQTYQDKPLTCVDCKQPFVWSAREQTFFAEKKFAPPKRCSDCRKKRRAQKNERKGNSRPNARGGNRR